FGRAASIPRKWLEDLFAFAPKPDQAFRVRETARRAASRNRPSDSFLEFCCSRLEVFPVSWDPQELRGRYLAHLDGLERQRRCEPVGR
ncbi:MAG: hypothetical protein ACRD96_24125, partial [Bryobacteraceae bacterium]